MDITLEKTILIDITVQSIFSGALYSSTVTGGGMHRRESLSLRIHTYIFRYIARLSKITLSIDILHSSLSPLTPFKNVYWQLEVAR